MTERKKWTGASSDSYSPGRMDATKPRTFDDPPPRWTRHVADGGKPTGFGNTRKSERPGFHVLGSRQ